MIMIKITLFYAGLNGIILFLLAGNVIRARWQNKVSLGDGGNKNLLQAIRMHGNASEYIPIILFLMLLLELSGSSPKVLNIVGVLLTGGRVLHAYGLMSSINPNISRFIGVNFTFIALVLSSVVCMLRYFGKM